MTRVKRAQLQAIQKEFELLHMKNGKIVADYFVRTLTVANKIRIHGEKMEYVAMIEKILRSMTPKYNYVVCLIEESNDNDALSIDKLQSSLLVHEQRMVRHEMDEQAFKVTQLIYTLGRGRGRSSLRCHGRGRS